MFLLDRARCRWTCLVLLLAQQAAAQQPAPQADPSDFGLEIPAGGPVAPGAGRRVILTEDDSERVALVHADVADRRIVITPEGRLRSVPIGQTKQTSQPFVGLTKDELAKQLTAKAFAGFNTRTSGHYLYVYNCSPGFYKATRNILETMHPSVVAYFKRQKFQVSEPPTPLVIVIFHTEEQFQKYHPMPPGVVAYYSAVSNYVVMYEQSKLVDIAPELAAKQSIATIAHEGVHQILHNIGIQQRLSRWPMWISEGLPEFFAPTSAKDRARWAGFDKVNDMRLYELRQVLDSNNTSMRELVEQTITAPRLSSTGYATSWALTSYLLKMKRNAFHAYLAEVSKRPAFTEAEPGPAATAAADRAQFSKHFGGDFQKLSANLLKYLQKFPKADPVANQTHFVVMLDTPTQKSAGVTTSPTAVRQWQQDALEAVPPNVRGRASFQIQSFPDRMTAENYAQQWLKQK